MIVCKVCEKQPHEISEYVTQAKIENITPVEFVQQEEEEEEGTFNPTTGFFYCTDCYTKIGMPLGTA